MLPYHHRQQNVGRKVATSLWGNTEEKKEDLNDYLRALTLKTRRNGKRLETPLSVDDEISDEVDVSYKDLLTSPFIKKKPSEEKNYGIEKARTVQQSQRSSAFEKFLAYEKKYAKVQSRRKSLESSSSVISSNSEFEISNEGKVHEKEGKLGENSHSHEDSSYHSNPVMVQYASDLFQGAAEGETNILVNLDHEEESEKLLIDFSSPREFEQTEKTFHSSLTNSSLLKFNRNLTEDPLEVVSGDRLSPLLTRTSVSEDSILEEIQSTHYSPSEVSVSDDEESVISFANVHSIDELIDDSEEKSVVQSLTSEPEISLIEEVVSKQEASEKTEQEISLMEVISEPKEKSSASDHEREVEDLSQNATEINQASPGSRAWETKKAKERLVAVQMKDVCIQTPLHLEGLERTSDVKVSQTSWQVPSFGENVQKPILIDAISSDASAKDIATQMLLQQIDLTRSFMDSHEEMYRNYYEAAKEISKDYQYVRVEETFQYLRKHRSSRQKRRKASAANAAK